MSIMDIWVPVFVAVVTGLLSFIASTIKSNHDVQKVKLENEAQMQRMELQHKDELEKAEKENEIAINKMKTEFDLKLTTYAGAKGTDVKYDFVEKLITQAITEPENAAKSMQGLENLANLAKQYKSKE